MTNSEIKKCEHNNYEPIGDCGEFKWCRDCGALNIFFKDWQHPTRPPEPTKAENGLVPLDTFKVCAFIDKYFSDAPLPKIKSELADAICQTFGTPSITKEQLLAILPEKKSCPRHSITDNDFTNDGDLCDCCTSFKGFNEAIDQMKQRIEEL